MPSLAPALDADLSLLRDATLLRTPHQVGHAQGPEVDVAGHRVLCFCSNNYLGLAAHPALATAMRRSAERDGTGAGASRLISGSMAAHHQAEERLADFTRTESALLFSSGYAANVGALQAIVDHRDIIFSDALNHASIIDGCRLAHARVVVYPHRDTATLEQLLTEYRPSSRRAIVVTDALFSMDGERAPVGALRRLCDQHDAWLMVDEAHAFGVLGPLGRGLCAEANIVPDIFMATLGKAAGVCGAFVAGTKNLRDLLVNRARSYVFSTALPPPVAAAITAAVDLVAAAEPARATLRHHASRLQRGLRDAGYEVIGDDTHILPVIIGDPAETMRLSEELLLRGVFAHGIRPPTVPSGTSRIRVAPMATHTDAHIDVAIQAFRALASERPFPQTVIASSPPLQARA